MKIISNNSNPQFKGFQNVISYNNGNFAYMAMKLNDNDGSADLSKWQSIQKELLHKKNPSDYIVFHCLENGNSNYFSVDTIALDLEHAETAKNEKFMIKTYDLLASLTKRIINSYYTEENRNLYLTLKEAYTNLSTILQEQNIVEALVTAGATKRVEHYKTADFINKKIAKNMARYFKL